MSTREELRQRRIELLLDRLEATAIRWAELEYQEGTDTGRHGMVKAGLTKRRGQAELRLKDLVLQTAPGDETAAGKAMTPSSVPRRHWRTYGNEPLPTPQERWAASTERARRNVAVLGDDGAVGEEHARGEVRDRSAPLTRSHCCPLA
jgi:hypothetical protein